MIQAGGDILISEMHKMSWHEAWHGVAWGKSTDGMEKICNNHNTKDLVSLSRLQQLQNNLTAEPRKQSLDDGVAGEAESTDGTTPVRRASRIQEGQKHHPLNLDSKTASQEGKTREPAYISLLYWLPEGFRLNQTRRHKGDIEALWSWPEVITAIAEHLRKFTIGRASR